MPYVFLTITKVQKKTIQNPFSKNFFLSDYQHFTIFFSLCVKKSVNFSHQTTLNSLKTDILDNQLLITHFYTVFTSIFAVFFAVLRKYILFTFSKKVLIRYQLQTKFIFC